MIFDNLEPRNRWDMFEMNPTPVMEKYVGKNIAGFKIIEGELEKIIKLVRDNFSTMNDSGDIDVIGRSGTFINKTDHNKLIERCFKQIFDLNDFRLIWSNSTPNALTMPRTFTFMDKGPDSNGRYTNKKLKVGVVVDAGLILYSELTAPELTAIILHEIGHNFYNSIFQTLADVPIGIGIKGISADDKLVDKTIIWLVSSLIKGRNGGFDILKIKAEIDEWIDKHVPFVGNIYRTITQTMHNMSTMLGITNMVIFIKKFKKFMDIQLVSFSSVFGYNMEKFSDSFAVDYGYGPQLASALHKMSTRKNTIETKIFTSIKGFNWIADIFNVNADIIRAAIDPHPTAQNRIRTGLDRLKRAQNDPDLDPQVKKDLLKQIDEYEKYYKEVYLNPNVDENKHNTFSVLSRIGIEKVFGGKMDLREFVYMLDPHKYK